MKIKMKMLFVPMVMVIMSVPSVTTFTTFTTAAPWTTWTTGFSVCLRYLTDYLGANPALKLYLTGFDPVTLGASSDFSYSLANDYSYSSLSFRPSIRFWHEVFAQDIWTRVCVTVDRVKKVAQVFSGSNMSIRKILPPQFVCPQCSRADGPVIDVPGFDGQLTDVQMWDYPLDHGGIILYMRSNAYRPSRGSVLTWEDISYSVSGNALLEDVYEAQEPQPISKRGRRRKVRGGRKNRERRASVKHTQADKEQAASSVPHLIVRSTQ
ncbi:uncharacterized protein [Paralichthys olivaceus]|uniref:uncharacterized protein n=1 Tax=Paralichthys olivaceus TaxID=8255 RepID=UPI003750585A